MVGHQVLVLSIGVRVPARQQHELKAYRAKHEHYTLIAYLLRTYQKNPPGAFVLTPYTPLEYIMFMKYMEDKSKGKLFVASNFYRGSD